MLRADYIWLVTACTAILVYFRQLFSDMNESLLKNDLFLGYLANQSTIIAWTLKAVIIEQGLNESQTQ